MNLKDYVTFQMIDVDVPDWVHWVAVDLDGTIAMFEFKPGWVDMDWGEQEPAGYWTKRKMKHRGWHGNNCVVDKELLIGKSVEELVWEW